MYVPMGVLLEDAMEKGYAVPAPDFIDFKMARLLIDTAAASRSPIILAYVDSFLELSELHSFKEVAEFIRYIANKVDIPVALNLDHSKKMEELEKALKGGFTSVMFDGSELLYEENVQHTREAVKIARLYNATVEGEIGHVGEASSYSVGDWRNMLTTKEDAKKFVEDTNVDALAVAIGTAHGIYKGIPHLDFERLRGIRTSVEVPLVLHGCSGTGRDNLKKAITYGVQKINIFTDIINAAKENLISNEKKLKEMNYFDIDAEMKKAMKTKFEEYIEIAGSANRY